MAKGKKGKKGKKSEEKKEKIQLKKEKQMLKSLKKEQSKKRKELKNLQELNDLSEQYENTNICIENKYKHININNTTNNSFVECEKPNPRHHGSITFINEEQCLVFGGEYKENNELRTYNDLFKYNIKKNKWKYYFTIDKKPKPRSSHQAVYYNKKLYIFGGELSSHSQFVHFNDLWCFDLKTNTFEEITTNEKKNTKPSPRSGHKMILWKKFLLLFGGFFDNGKYTEYFNDMYLYIINDNIWINLTDIYKNHLFNTITGISNGEKNDSELKEKEEILKNKTNKWKKNSGGINHNNTIDIHTNINTTINTTSVNTCIIDTSTNYSIKGCNSLMKATFMKNFDFSSYMPSGRSNVALFTDKTYQNIYIYGGYAKVRNVLDMEVGEQYNDLWVINLQFSNESNISVSFKKLKKSICQPSKRAGFATCVYKNSLILFGGVFDRIEKILKKGKDANEAIIKESSLFFNDLYLFDMSKEQWSRLNLKNKMNCKKKNIQKSEIYGEKEEQEQEEEEQEQEQEEEEQDGSIENKKGEKKKRIIEEKDTTPFRGKRAKCIETNEMSEGGNEKECFQENETNDLVYFDAYGNKKTTKIKNIEKIKTEQYHASSNEKKESDNVIMNLYHKGLKEKGREKELELEMEEEIKECGENEDIIVAARVIDVEYADKINGDFVNGRNAHTREFENNKKESYFLTKSNETKETEETEKTEETEEKEEMENRKKDKQSVNTNASANIKFDCSIPNNLKDKEKKKKKKSIIEKKKRKKKFIVNEFEEPFGRINCHIFCVGKYVYVYGGMYEYMNNPILLGDFWRIDLDKREKWEIIDKGNLDNIYVEDASETESNESNLSFDSSNVSDSDQSNTTYSTSETNISETSSSNTEDEEEGEGEGEEEKEEKR